MLFNPPNSMANNFERTWLLNFSRRVFDLRVIYLRKKKKKKKCKEMLDKIF